MVGWCPATPSSAKSGRPSGGGARKLPVYVEAAWMHHRFVRTHPFQDGNGRVSRMLMAYAFIRRGEPPPIVTAVGRNDYIDVLETANTGDLRAFSDYLGRLALVTHSRSRTLLVALLAKGLKNVRGRFASVFSSPQALNRGAALRSDRAGLLGALARCRRTGRCRR